MTDHPTPAPGGETWRCERRQCGYQVRRPFAQSAFCQQPAHWAVHYTTPDDGESMRTRAVAIRCSHHTDARYLPKGVTQVVTERLDVNI